MAPLNTVIAEGDIKANSPSSMLEGEDNPLPSEGTSSNVLYITDWFPPEPLPKTEFTALPT